MVQVHIAKLKSAPHFVADAPPLDVVRLRMTVGGTPAAHRCIGRTISVLNLLSRRMVVTEASVDDEQCLGAY